MTPLQIERIQNKISKIKLKLSSEQTGITRSQLVNSLVAIMDMFIVR